MNPLESVVLRALAARHDGKDFMPASLLPAALSLGFQTPPLVSDIYEMASGGFVARITEAGRKAVNP